MPVPSARSVFAPNPVPAPSRALALEERFFRGLRLANGTYKLTYPNRMPDVDAALCALLPASGDIELLDVGVSSGVTTLELIAALFARGLRPRTVAADIAIHASIRPIWGLGEALVDPRGNVLQVSVGGVAKFRTHDPEGSWRRRLLHAVFGRAERRLAAVGGEGVPVRLVSPRLLERTDVEVVEHDLARNRPEWRGRFGVVRAANILNHDYFDPDTLLRMAGHLRSYLAPGGLMVVCRTLRDRTNHGTLFRLDPAGELVVADRIGAGSEVEEIALATAGAASERSAG